MADREKQRTSQPSQSEIEDLKAKVEEAESRAKSVQAELDDLLLVLGEMEETATRHKEKIKSLGGEVTDDDDEEEE
jgi:intracellular protein transport protein USO1